MLVENVFWVVTIIVLISAGCFIVPPIWLDAAKMQLCVRTQAIATICLALFLVFVSYFLYFKFGASAHFKDYFSAHNVAQRANAKQIRPLYARIQRELVKSHLGLKLDAENVALILNFAQRHSQLEQGVLNQEVEQLLEAVLRTVPQQVTALNLLAINAYKKEQYALAIAYWQSILEQVTASMHNTDIEKTLQNKIIETKNKLVVFESKQTN